MADRERLRRERVADVEGLGRRANEEVAKAATDWTGDEERRLRCECADDGCRQPVLVSRAVYERIRGDPMLFLVRPGHVVPVAEDALERGKNYWVVRKHEDIRDRVEASDPRSPR